MEVFFFFRSESLKGSITSVPNSKCSVINLEVDKRSQGIELMFTVKHRRYVKTVII